jgi:hypothetical protein
MPLSLGSSLSPSRSARRSVALMPLLALLIASVATRHLLPVRSPLHGVLLRERSFLPAVAVALLLDALLLARRSLRILLSGNNRPVVANHPAVDSAVAVAAAIAPAVTDTAVPSRRTTRNPLARTPEMPLTSLARPTSKY